MSTPNRVARYVGDGRVAIVEEPAPSLPPGGLLVRTEACGLCSGELMAWYMDRKVPHVLGHEVAGIVEASEDPRFPVGSRVFPHHHAPCGACDVCARGAHVHCPTWRRTKLLPGGMADRFAVPAENLADTVRVDDLRPEDAALIEPLACVAKSVAWADTAGPAAVVGLGVMGLMHALLLREHAPWGLDLNPARRAGTVALGLRATAPEEAPDEAFATVFVCPGFQPAFDLGLRLVRPGGQVVLFAPLGPDEDLRVPQAAYFKEVTLHHAYSCGPNDTRAAVDALRAGRVRAEQVVSHFVPLDAIPEAYGRMKRGEILKPMVVWR